MRRKSTRLGASGRVTTARGRLPVELLPLPVLRVDPAGVIRESNKALSHALHHDHLVAGRTLEHLVEPGDVELVRALLRRETPQGDSITLHFQAGDGTRALTFEVFPSGRSLWLVALADQPELWRMVENAAETKARFLSTMSHELRTPLNAVLGYAGLLRDGVYGPVTESQDRAVRAIVRRARDLQLLIDDVLALSRIESGSLGLETNEFDPGAVVAEVRDAITPYAREKALSVTIRSGMHTLVTLDRAKYKQVVLQLAANAVKFTPPHGDVELSLDPDTGDRFTTRVRDTGIGIAAEDLLRIFDNFEQVENGTTRRYYGIGLGLPIANRIVRLLGGTIVVESTPGAGATFSVTLPVRREADAMPAPVVAEDGQTDDPTIVAIDDDPEVLSLLRDSLVPAHFRVAGARSGALGVELARALHPVVITLDIMMPDKDGWQVLSELKADPELRTIPVIVLSNLSERARGTTLGAAEYLVKPVERNVLIDTIERLRAGQRQQPYLH